jgi:hypothetical protein
MSKRRTPAAKPAKKRADRSTPAAARRRPRGRAIEAVPVTAEELRALQRELERRLKERAPSGRRRSEGRRGRPAPQPMRWNPDPEDVQKSVAQLVLTIVEFLRRLMERQAIRRMDSKTLSEAEIEAVGTALMTLEKTVRDIGARFGLAPEDLNLDLGPIRLI